MTLSCNWRLIEEQVLIAKRREAEANEEFHEEVGEDSPFSSHGEQREAKLKADMWRTIVDTYPILRPN